ncbi:MAG: hypothetical protein KGY45_04165 [Hadesarchaea archaeon]|nr:hypothetical protein [Hadesarchaea archaeon]
MRVLKHISNNFKKSEETNLPLWKKKKLLKTLNPLNAIWGHTQINEENTREILKTLKKLSSATPHLTWILYGENKIFDGELIIKNGKLIEEKNKIKNKRIYL